MGITSVANPLFACFAKALGRCGFVKDACARTVSTAISVPLYILTKVAFIVAEANPFRLVSLLTGVILPTPHDGRQEPPSEIDPWLH